MQNKEDQTATSVVNFALALDDTAWSFITSTMQSADFMFDVFPDVEVIELDFIRPNSGSIYAHLCGAPSVWIRTDGVVEKYDTTDSDYDLSPTIIDLIDEVSLIPVNDWIRHVPDDQQVVRLILSPSICLVVGIANFTEQTKSHMCANISSYSGFVGVADGGEMTASRIQAQLMSVCDVLSIQTNITIDLGEVSGGLCRT